jgi:hypothetical protein
MKLSPFTPLNFAGSNASDGLHSRYTQVFAPTDQIMIQVVADAEETAPTGTLYDACTDEVVDTITWNEWEINEDTVIYFHVFCGLSDGFYKLTIEDKTSDVFRVTSDEGILSKTTLLQYANKDNKQRDDVAFVIDGVRYFFDFRVPGGFKDSGWEFGVENEQFTTQYQDVVELYASDYITKTFTMGNSIGVPVWFGALLNRLLTCQFVYINAERYVRDGSSVPSMESLIEGLDSFVFTQQLRKTVRIDADFDDENQVAIRRVDEDYNRIDDDTNIRILEI